MLTDTYKACVIGIIVAQQKGYSGVSKIVAVLHKHSVKLPLLTVGVVVDW